MKVINNSYPILREAKVLNTTDPEELGRIQLKVYPELSDIPDADCPWCLPTTSGVHDKSFGVPLVGKPVSCIVWNRYWNEITFLPFSISKPTEHLFADWMKNQRPAIADMKTDPEEEHLVVDQYDDDFTIFHDTKNNQHGFLHPTGTYGVVNKDGSVYVQSVEKSTFHSKDSNLFMELDSKTGNVDIKSKGSVTETIDKNMNRKVKENAEDTITGNWKINVTGNAVIKSDGKTDIEATGDVNVKAGGNAKVDATGNVDVKGVNAAITATGNVDVKGVNVTVEAAALLTLRTGDATPWMPNVIPVCPFGVNHGGSGAGISKLRGS